MDLLSILQTKGGWRESLIVGALVSGMMVASGQAQDVAKDAAAPTEAQASTPDGAAAGRLEIELNRLEQRDKACRLSFVYRNRLGTTLDALQLEAVLFDTDDRVERFIVLSSKGLPENKIRVQQFDIGGLDCSGLGAILVNDVKACDGEGLTAETCLSQLSLSSRTDAKLHSSVAK